MNFRKIIISIFIFISIAGSAVAQNWQLVWSDEFNGTTLDNTVWAPVNMGTGFGNKELQYYTSRAQNLSVQNGNLVINALLGTYTVGTTSWKYTSAKISTQNLKSFLYGKIEARIKLPGAGAGTWPAFWTLGYGSWPACGELDICEFQGSVPGQFQSNIHTQNYNGTNGSNFHLVKPYPNISDTFHIWGIEWTPTTSIAPAKVKFFLDGVQYWTYNSLSVTAADYPFNSQIYLILNLAIGGTMGGTVDETALPKQMLVDYVRYYKDAATGINDVVSLDKPTMNTVFNDNLNINFPSAQNGKKSISLIDLNGKLVYSSSTNEMNCQINGNQLNKGMYLVKIETESKEFTQKVIKN